MAWGTCWVRCRTILALKGLNLRSKRGEETARELARILEFCCLITIKSVRGHTNLNTICIHGVAEYKYSTASESASWQDALVSLVCQGLWSHKRSKSHLGSWFLSQTNKHLHIHPPVSFLARRSYALCTCLLVFINGRTSFGSWKFPDCTLARFGWWSAEAPLSS